MSARGPMAAALTSVADWLVAPEEQPAPRADEPVDEGPRPVVAVAGVRRRVGVTTVARLVGAVLAARDPGGGCVVTSEGGTGSVPLGLPAGGRLARRLGPYVDGRLRACGRLCLVEGADRSALAATARDLAPLVLDVSDPAEAAAAVSVADHAVLVAGPEAEPSLAAVIAESLGVVGPEPAIVLNRVRRADGHWPDAAHLALPDSRLAAQLAAAGRDPRGAMGEAGAALADRLGC